MNEIKTQNEVQNDNQNEAQNEVQNDSSPILPEVLISDDGMTGYIKLYKPQENAEPISKEQLFEELDASHITYGIKESSIEKLAERPIFNIKIEVAKGQLPTNGEDGQVILLVKRDSEYKPNYNLEGNIDYKNIDYFQLVKKDQVLCEVIKETEGIDGVNIFGASVPAKRGKPPRIPSGRNTELVEDDTKLIATCDGVVRFVRDTIDINDMLKINSNVDQLTGNINFSGDVTIEGDVSDGFTVKSGGNIIVKGVVEDAEIEAAGNVHISNGINGGGERKINIGGDLRCKYIENAIINVNGNISADYIIESRITCMGNIELAGTRELVVGGEIKVLGELRAKDIGNEKDRITKIEVLGTEIYDTENINRLKTEIDELNNNALILLENASKLSKAIKQSGNSELINQLSTIKKQMILLRDKIDYKTKQLKQLENEWVMEYNGFITCKRKMYQGVRINFGEARFYFDFDNIEHCKIYLSEGEIIQGLL